jgi:SET domain/PHD-zinc-finger like domain/PHD-like zinc-binding domain/PHD-finger/F/Y-rich N-terminus
MGRRVAVFWDDDHCFYPAVIESHNLATGMSTLHYSDGDVEVLNLGSTAHINLPPEPVTPCGGRASVSADRGGQVCGQPINLQETLRHTSTHAVCSACTTAFHISCASDVALSRGADGGRRTRRPARLNDPAALAKWRCPDCPEVAVEAECGVQEGGGAVSVTVKRERADDGNGGSAQKRAGTPLGPPPFRGPEPLPGKPRHVIIHDVRPEFAADLGAFIPGVSLVSTDAASYSIPEQWRSTLDALATRHAKRGRIIVEDASVETGVPLVTSVPSNTAYREQSGPSGPAAVGDEAEVPGLEPRTPPPLSAADTSHCELSPTMMAPLPFGSGSRRGGSGSGLDRANRERLSGTAAFPVRSDDAPLLSDHALRSNSLGRILPPLLPPPAEDNGEDVRPFLPPLYAEQACVETALDARTQLEGDAVKASFLDLTSTVSPRMSRDGVAPVRGSKGYPWRDSRDVNAAKLMEKAESVQARRGVANSERKSAKRPRSSDKPRPATSATPLPPVDDRSLADGEAVLAAVCEVRPETKRAPKRQRAEADWTARAHEKACGFCERTGSIPECEGEMLGPFAVGVHKLYAHRNCLFWAPETVEVSQIVKGRVCRSIEEYEPVFRRSRKMKCIYCSKFGASISCMYMRTKCCKPLHFRCALLAGASLVLGENLETLGFCPAHRCGPFDNNHCPHDDERMFVQTPLKDDYFDANNMCGMCKRDNFDVDTGSLLECATCKKRIHFQCVLGEVVDTGEGAFAVDSHRGTFKCQDCASCFGCDLLLGSGEKQATGDSVDLLASQNKTSSIVYCTGCKLPCGHSSCLPMLSSESLRVLRPKLPDGEASQVLPSAFRCERCRTCTHCGRCRVPAETWNESILACCDCTTQYVNDAVCPMCDRAYLEDEDNMISCDGCEKWIHGRDCCGMSPEEFTEASASDRKYYCPKCKLDGKCPGGGACKASMDSGRVEDIEEESGPFVTAEDEDVSREAELEYEEYIEKHDFASEAEHDVSILSANRTAKGDDEHAADVVPHLDLCRRCGSGGEEEFLRFCADCGDALHGFCLAKVLPPRSASSNYANSSAGVQARYTVGGLGIEGAPWRCEKCALCQVCGCGNDTDGGSNHVDERLCCCDQCGMYVHPACVASGANRARRRKTGDDSFLCTQCSVCELCRSSSRSVSRLGDALYCDRCRGCVYRSNPCSICKLRYPACPESETFVPKSDKESLAASSPFAKCCGTCNALVHAVCDPMVATANSLYVCSLCVVESANPALTDDPKASVATGVSSPDDDCSTDFLDPLAGTAPSVSGPSSVQDADESPLVRPNGVCTRATNMHEELGEYTTSAETQPGVWHAAADGSQRNVSSHDKEHRWNISPVDDRVCEMCLANEDCGNLRGRLLPWMSEGMPNAKLWWVHVVCAIWTQGVSRVFPKGTSPWHGTCFLVADRRWFGAVLRTRSCRVCNETGATLSCAHEGCDALYHYACAQASGCRMQVKLAFGEDDGQELIELRDVVSLTMACNDHCGEGSDTSTVADESLAGFVYLSGNRRINVHAPLRFSCDLDVGRPKDGIILRAGGIVVLRSGQLVANSSLFFEDGALVPTAYRAVRRHWSLKHPGKRCNLLLDISGTARSGPMFTVRFSDDSNAFIAASTAAAAWERVAGAVEQARLFALGVERTTVSSLVLCKGIEVFGLSSCEATVSWIEGLPLSFLMVGRHSFLYGHPEVPKDLPFRVPAMRWESPPNEAGSARLEGYVPKRHPLARISAEGSSYKNVPTGECFQMHVAMGLGRALHEAEEDTGVKQVVMNGLGARSKGRKSSSGDDITRVAGNTAHLPQAMQHRAMLKSWKRRTVVLRSGIEGWGVFATEDIASGDMVIEYMGEIIRPITSDEREAFYDSQGIGCYMFEVAPGRIVDATKVGNRARYINHSCEPNCFSRTVTVEHGRRVIVIFAKRNIKRGEELCYDYQFPLDAEDRVACACGSAKCKGFMN